MAILMVCQQTSCQGMQAAYCLISNFRCSIRYSLSEGHQGTNGQMCFVHQQGRNFLMPQCCSNVYGVCTLQATNLCTTLETFCVRLAEEATMCIGIHSLHFMFFLQGIAVEAELGRAKCPVLFAAPSSLAPRQHKVLMLGLLHLLQGTRLRRQACYLQP